jgi:hypothetical protein
MGYCIPAVRRVQEELPDYDTAADENALPVEGQGVVV